MAPQVSGLEVELGTIVVGFSDGPGDNFTHRGMEEFIRGLEPEEIPERVAGESRRISLSGSFRSKDDDHGVTAMVARSIEPPAGQAVPLKTGDTIDRKK